MLLQISCNKCLNCNMELENIFKDNSLRLTAPRQALFDTLAKANKPLDITAIIAGIPQGDRTSVYRNIDLFVRLNIIEVIHVDWKKRYELAEPFAPHHHHLHCTKCGKFTSLETPKLEDLVASIASSHGYIVNDHHFELHGVCPTCRSK